MDQQPAVSRRGAISPAWLAASRRGPPTEEIVMRSIIVVAIAATLLGSASVATASERRAPCTAAAPQQWLSLQDLTAKVEAQGYRVRKIELERGCGEADVVDRNGVRAELRLDPVDGRIVERH
jgi:hypothetical protein